jgi:hypothetical protein
MAERLEPMEELSTDRCALKPFAVPKGQSAILAAFRS